jgi:hypothetical protein
MKPYQKELKRMGEERQKYFPAMDYLLSLHNSHRGKILDIKDSEHAFTICELLDLNYADREVVRVHETFNEIDEMIYTGKYPLTDMGRSLFHQEMHRRQQRKIRFRAAVLGSAVLFLAIILIILLH